MWKKPHLSYTREQTVYILINIDVSISDSSFQQLN